MESSTATVKKIWRWLVRKDITVILLSVVLFLTALGSFFPQQPSAISSVDLVGWQNDLQARYTTMTKILATLGLFNFYQTPVYQGLVIALGVLTFLCTLDRWRVVWWKTFHRQVKAPDSIFMAGSLMAEFELASVSAFEQVLRTKLADLGFRLRSQRDGKTLYLRADRNRLAPLGTLVSHLGLTILLAGVVLTTLCGWRENLFLTMQKSTSLQHRANLSLVYADFDIERYPDGNVAGYVAMVDVLDSNKLAQRGQLSLNNPLTFTDVTFYLQGYEFTETGILLMLLAVHDPGYAVVILGSLFLLVGMTVTFNFPACTIFARLDSSDKIVRLAGQADRRAYGFEDEFAVLVATFKREVSMSEGEMVC